MAMEKRRWKKKAMREKTQGKLGEEAKKIMGKGRV